MDLAFLITTSLVRLLAHSVLKIKWSIAEFLLLFPGTQSTNICFAPVKLSSFKNNTTSWVGFSGGQHHTLCLNSEGDAFVNLICVTLTLK